jgi:NADH-quinone oxidoreductase subunit L
VLAYSTVSQLGYMFAAVGLGAYAAGIFHLVTHAFFKALLFLGAGSVIHGMHGEQDLRKMGGLAPRMMTTTITMTIGGIGLAGVPWITAGFFSKEEILGAALGGHRYVLFALLLVGAGLTTFYTFRLLLLAFFTDPRMSKEVARHVHESPAVMTVPLVALAVLTMVTGWFVGIPSDKGVTPFARFLAPVFPVHEGHHGGVLLLALSFLVVGLGIGVAVVLYKLGPVRAEAVAQPRTPVHAFLLNAWYFDRVYDRAIVRPLHGVSVFAARVIDLGLIDGLVNGIGRAFVASAGVLRHLQTGYIVNYALTMLAGAVVIVGFLLAR